MRVASQNWGKSRIKTRVLIQLFIFLNTVVKQILRKSNIKIHGIFNTYYVIYIEITRKILLVSQRTHNNKYRRPSDIGFRSKLIINVCCTLVSPHCRRNFKLGSSRGCSTTQHPKHININTEIKVLREPVFRSYCNTSYKINSNILLLQQHILRPQGGRGSGGSKILISLF